VKAWRFWPSARSHGCTRESSQWRNCRRAVLAWDGRGWLRLLASEVAGLRFQWPALRIVAQAQWDLKDYVGARKRGSASATAILTNSRPMSLWRTSIAARVIEHVARIRVQLPTSCPEGALFRTVALGLMRSGP
jgi:hypothetical protein